MGWGGKEADNDGGLFINPKDRIFRTLVFNKTKFINDPQFDGVIEKKELEGVVGDVEALFKDLAKQSGSY